MLIYCTCHNSTLNVGLHTVAGLAQSREKEPATLATHACKMMSASSH